MYKLLMVEEELKHKWQLPHGPVLQKPSFMSRGKKEKTAAEEKEKTLYGSGLKELLWVCNKSLEQVFS